MKKLECNDLGIIGVGQWFNGHSSIGDNSQATSSDFVHPISEPADRMQVN
jgi:hypothetical protein